MGEQKSFPYINNRYLITSENYEKLLIFLRGFGVYPNPDAEDKPLAIVITKGRDGWMKIRTESARRTK